MTRLFVETKQFTKQSEALEVDDETLRLLEIDIMRKARISLDNKGKSGGARVCFVDFVIFETVYFITVYGKKEKDNLTKKECVEIKKAINILEKTLGGESDGKQCI